jgi:hypothetical protein
MLGKPDCGHTKSQFAGDPEADAVEQPPNVRHRHPAWRLRVRRQPVAQRQQGANRFGSKIPRDETDVRQFRTGLRREAAAPGEPPAAAPDANRLVVARTIGGIGQHAPRRVEDLLGPGGRRDDRRRRAGDEFRPHQACLGLVLSLDLVRSSSREQPENVIPGDAG